MDYSSSDLDAAATKAIKIVGKDGDVLAPDPDPCDLIADANKLANTANKTRNQLLKDIDQYENALDKITNATKLYERKLEKWDFKLDEKKPDDKKKIVQARKVLTDSMAKIDAQAKEAKSGLDSLEKALAADIK
jgi:hypothetical protein